MEDTDIFLCAKCGVEIDEQEFDEHLGWCFSCYTGSSEAEAEAESDEILWAGNSEINNE